jgi:hypothetical protein
MGGDLEGGWVDAVLAVLNGGVGPVASIHQYAFCIVGHRGRSQQSTPQNRRSSFAQSSFPPFVCLF